jgi:hypothetical protein
MRALALVGLLIAVSGCSSLKTTSSPEAGSAQATPPAAAPAPATAPPPAPPPAAPPPVAPAPVTPPPVAPPAPVTAPPVAPPPAPVAAAPAAVAASAAPSHAAAAPAKSPAAAHPVKQPGASAAQSPANPPPPASPAAPAPPAAAPTLNLADLEQRLRETRAIGVFTKLSLKNQVDDLLKSFRALYRDPSKRPSAELRQRYDGLLLKVLSLLQDGDPPLAAAIASSREAIWGILADPEKFAKMDT